MGELDATRSLLNGLFQAHPWHGVAPGPDVPKVVTTFVEIVPTDGVKYELEKASGLLHVDRPQRYSSQCPTLYGFIPQTYCGVEVADRCEERTGIREVVGDGDPLDICLLTEKPVPHGNFLARSVPIGGLRMVDAGQADDKIIAVLEGDIAFGALTDIAQCPAGIVDRLRHYFLSYKQLPGETQRRVQIAEVYGQSEAHEVILRSCRDYRAKFGSPDERLQALLRLLK